jgi:hypothetical protein
MSVTPKRGVDALGYLVIGLVIAALGGLVLSTGNSSIGWLVVGVGGIFVNVGTIALGVQIGMEEVERRRAGRAEA